MYVNIFGLKNVKFLADIEIFVFDLLPRGAASRYSSFDSDEEGFILIVFIVMVGVARPVFFVITAVIVVI